MKQLVRSHESQQLGWSSVSVHVIRMFFGSLRNQPNKLAADISYPQFSSQRNQK
tara:strand:+ start:117 stop:278 length:162 start_codon:yes stop_codon:yes gene_type:complete